MTPPKSRDLTFGRRDVLKLSGTALAAAAGPHLAPRGAAAQTPKRGGTLNLRLWDPPHFDPELTISYKSHIPYTFTHSRLLKHKAGPSVVPGTFPIEGDLARSADRAAGVPASPHTVHAAYALARATVGRVVTVPRK